MEEINLKPVICRAFSNINDFYDVGEVLGTGQYSTVYRAIGKQGPNANTIVAVKVYMKAKRGIEHGVRIEMEVLKELQSPDPYDNVMRFIDIVEDEMRIYVVLEYVGGGNLFDRIAKSHHFSERSASALVRKIVEVLDRMHSKDIVHRDVKPQNIMFADAEGQVLKFIDFSSAYKKKKDTPMTKPVGTVKFMAPEMLMKKEYTEAVDMWSLGVVVYIILSGAEPFQGNGFALNTAICNGTFTFPDATWNGISGSAKDFVSQLLCVNPAKRITANKALLHPWLEHNEGLYRTLSDNKLSNSMRSCRDLARIAREEKLGIAQGVAPREDAGELPPVQPCGVCGRHVLGGVKFGDGVYHEQCFTCTACCMAITPITNLKTKDGMPFHHGCLQKLISQSPMWQGAVGSGSSAQQQQQQDMRPSTSPQGPRRGVRIQDNTEGVGAPPNTNDRRASLPSNSAPVLFKAKFCYECGTKYDNATMKFCVQCGEARV
eukprot:PhF_6_TR36164/c0_g1_i1/m.52605/K08794/CAMK1; calcium/calmodulin-dependent protein kinase I